MDLTVLGALITAFVALTAVCITAGLQVFMWLSAKQGTKTQEILEYRRNALFSALQVIDHVYANTEWNGKEMSDAHEWDIKEARNAINKMIVYCKDPDRTVGAFMNAIGVHNPDIEPPGMYSPQLLSEFRHIVCMELELPKTNFIDDKRIWLAQLPGTYS